MASTPITRMIAAAAAATLAVGVLPSSAAVNDGLSPISPRVAELLYLACIDRAPTTPDSHERWVASCRQRAADG